MQSQRLRRTSAGFTVVEIAIAMTILVVMLASFGAFQALSQEASQSLVLRTELERRADRALHAIRLQLRGAEASTLVPPPTSDFGSDTIQFRTPGDVTAAGVIVWNAPTRIAIQMDAREADNGLDDDGDGRIDERMLVVTREIGTPDERSVTICHGLAAWAEGETGGNAIDDNGNGVIDERGFNVSRVGDLLFLRLTLESRAEDGRILRCTTSTAIVLHN